MAVDGLTVVVPASVSHLTPPPLLNGAVQQAPMAESIQLLPLYSMALQKNVAFRGGTDVRVDERAFVQAVLANMPVDHSRCFTYPRMFRCVRGWRYLLSVLEGLRRCACSCKRRTADKDGGESKEVCRLQSARASETCHSAVF